MTAKVNEGAVGARRVRVKTAKREGIDKIVIYRCRSGLESEPQKHFSGQNASWRFHQDQKRSRSCA